MDVLLCVTRHLTQNGSVTLGISGSPKLMETNRESSTVPRAVRRRAYNVNDIYYGALCNYTINTRSFESAKNCSLRDARYC